MIHQIRKLQLLHEWDLDSQDRSAARDLWKGMNLALPTASRHFVPNLDTDIRKMLWVTEQDPLAGEGNIESVH